MEHEPTFEDCLKAIQNIIREKKLLKSKVKRLIAKIEKIDSIEKDLILMLANEEMYEKLRGINNV